MKQILIFSAIFVAVSLMVVSSFGCCEPQKQRDDFIWTPVQACATFCMTSGFHGDHTINGNGCFCKGVRE